MAGNAFQIGAFQDGAFQDPIVVGAAVLSGAGALSGDALVLALDAAALDGSGNVAARGQVIAAPIGGQGGGFHHFRRPKPRLPWLRQPKQPARIITGRVRLAGRGELRATGLVIAMVEGLSTLVGRTRMTTRAEVQALAIAGLRARAGMAIEGGTLDDLDEEALFILDLLGIVQLSRN